MKKSLIFITGVLFLIGFVSGAPTYECSDGIDNDGDTFIDYPSDPGCASLTDNVEYNVPVIQPTSVMLWQDASAHVTTRPHNRNLIYDPTTENYFAFFGVGTSDTDGITRNRWKSSSDGITWATGGQAYYRGTGQSSSQDALLDGDKIIYLHFSHDTWNLGQRAYSIKVFDILGNDLSSSSDISLLSWNDPGQGGFYGSLAKDTNGYYWAAVRLVDWTLNPVSQKTGIFRSTNPNDPTLWESSPTVLTQITYKGASVPDVVALDNGKVIVISKQETNYWEPPLTSELLISFYDPFNGGWQSTYTLLDTTEISDRIRTIAEFDSQTNKLHLFYSDKNGNLYHMTLDSPYTSTDWSSKPGVLVASGLNPLAESDISMCMDYSTNPASLYAAYLQDTSGQEYYRIRYYNGLTSTWQSDELFGLQSGLSANEVSLVKDCTQKVAALYAKENSNGKWNVMFQEYLKPISCIHSADINPCDGVIDITELMTYIDRWKNNDPAVTTSSLFDALVIWKKGEG